MRDTLLSSSRRSDALQGVSSLPSRTQQPSDVKTRLPVGVRSLNKGLEAVSFGMEDMRHCRKWRRQRRQRSWLQQQVSPDGQDVVSFVLGRAHLAHHRRHEKKEPGCDRLDKLSALSIIVPQQQEKHAASPRSNAGNRVSSARYGEGVEGKMYLTNKARAVSGGLKLQNVDKFA